MKINLKKLGIVAEGDIEGVAKKVLDNHEKDWKEKFDSKHNAKKEIMELKHKHKLEGKNKKSRYMDLKLEYEKEKEKNNTEKLEKKTRNKIKIISTILFFVYGVFCISGFRDNHTIAASINLVQTIFVLISIFTSMELFKLFKNDYKIFLMLSVFLVILWLAFAV